MKKIALIVLIALCCFQNTVFAQTEKLSFIYINGSNNNNERMKTWYENGVKHLHPTLRKKILSNKQLINFYSPQDTISIKEEPVVYFWGNKSKEDLDFLMTQVDITKAATAYGAFLARTLITEYLHDAIWVQKAHNMSLVLDDLNIYVKQEALEGNNVVLLGYSAGTFVAYEYMLNKLRYINLYNFFTTLKMDKDFLAFVEKNPKKDTCISALTHDATSIGTLSASGHIILTQNPKLLKEKYLKLDNDTEKYCAPDKKVKGMVNFASPLVLFYSDLADSDYEINYYNKLLTKYIFENGLFQLTVNFREDPLGFPTSRNLTVQETAEKIEMPINNPTGVIYDNSSLWSKKGFTKAHTSYWTARDVFAKGIVDTFIEGYKFQYDADFQKKVIEKRNKMFIKKTNLKNITMNEYSY